MARLVLCSINRILGGGQPDSDMKVDFGLIGIGKIGKIGISDFLTSNFVFLTKSGTKKILKFPIFQNPLQFSEYFFLS